MQVDYVSLFLRLRLPSAVMMRHLPCSPHVVGEALASAVDGYCAQHKLGYYPALDYFKHVGDFDSALIDTAEQIAWFASKLTREELQVRLRPVFSTVKFQSIQTEAFSMPAIRPRQADALAKLARHFTPDTVKLELLVSLIRKEGDARKLAAEGYARKMMHRWLADAFETVEVTASRQHQ
jgi:hypothetical protein